MKEPLIIINYSVCPSSVYCVYYTSFLPPYLYHLLFLLSLLLFELFASRHSSVHTYSYTSRHSPYDSRFSQPDSILIPCSMDNANLWTRRAKYVFCLVECLNQANSAVPANCLCPLRAQTAMKAARESISPAAIPRSVSAQTAHTADQIPSTPSLPRPQASPLRPQAPPPRSGLDPAHSHPSAHPRHPVVFRTLGRRETSGMCSRSRNLSHLLQS